MENEVTLWTGDQLTLANMEKVCRHAEEALHAREFSRAPVKLAQEKNQGKSGGAKTEDTSSGSDKQSNQGGGNPEKNQRKGRGERRREKRERQPLAIEAAAATPPRGNFSGTCHGCGKEGHMKRDCTEIKNRGPRKPGAYCNHCGRHDSHTEDECWQKYPDKKPARYPAKQETAGKAPPAAGAKRGAKTAYAAQEDSAGPSNQYAEDDDWDPSEAWSVSFSGGDAQAVRAMAVTADEGPQLRASTEAQRDTTAAARARGEAERLAKRAKEDRLRKGGPPPAFKPKGERPPPEPPSEEEDEDLGGPRRRRKGVNTEPQGLQEVTLPPAFQEYSPTDRRYQGLDALTLVGTREELLQPVREGPIAGETVKLACGSCASGLLCGWRAEPRERRDE